MEISSPSAKWISEWEMDEESALMDGLELTKPLDFWLDELKFEEFYGSAVETPTPAKKQLKSESQSEITFGAPSNPKGDSSSSSSTHIISFENSNCKYGKLGSSVQVQPKIEMAYESFEGNFNSSSLIKESWRENNNSKDEYCSSRSYGQGIKRATSNNRNPLHARDHVIAERKRREKLSQRFIALSALIPGLNKVDKASILGGAVRYVKELQERVKEVEEQAIIMSKEPAVNVKRFRLISSSDDDDDGGGDTSSSDENSSCGGGAVGDIEVRILNKDVLLRIHCHKRKGCLSYLLNKIESLNLTILNSSAFPFGHSKLHITILAQVDVGFCMTVEDVAKNLRQALLEFI